MLLQVGAIVLFVVYLVASASLDDHWSHVLAVIVLTALIASIVYGFVITMRKYTPKLRGRSDG
jgi:uncharacterized membrane protein YccC